MIKKTPLSGYKDSIMKVIGNVTRQVARIAMQPGRHDLYLSIGIVGLFLIPLHANPVAAQVGVDEAQSVLCQESTGVNIAQIITIGLGLISMYFIMKFLFRMMTGLDKAGSTDSGAQAQGKQEAKGGIYSLVAALLPVLVPLFLKTAGIDVATCLFPTW